MSSAIGLQELYERLKRKYRFLDGIKLKTKQKAALNHILNGKDVFAVLPTGYGKSLLFVLPPLLLNEVGYNASCAFKANDLTMKNMI